MILSDKDIKLELMNKELKIIPEPEVIQPASVDLKLGDIIKTLDGESWNLNNGGYNLEPNEFILASTYEHVEIPDYLAARVDGKSSIGRLGLSIHITAGYIDPGFKGNITLEIHNCSNQKFRLHKKIEICQLVLEQLSSPCENPYGSECLNSHYQNSKGTVYSKYTGE
jgi:dCTP deaminase